MSEAPSIFAVVERAVQRAATPEELVDKWRFISLFAHEHWTNEMSVAWYSRSLAYHLAVCDLPWARDFMREASHLRAQQIVEEFGWPDRDWLEEQRAYWVRALTGRNRHASKEQSK